MSATGEVRGDPRTTGVWPVSEIANVRFLAHNSSDLLPLDATAWKLVKSVSGRRDGREEAAVYRAADHRVIEGSGGRRTGEGAVPQARFQRRGVLRLALEVRRHAGA